MKMKELKEKSKVELEKLLIELLEKSKKLRFDIVSKQAKNHQDYRKTKRDIARIKTLIRG